MTPNEQSRPGTELVETPFRRALPGIRLATVEGVADVDLEAFRVTYVNDEAHRDRVIARAYRTILDSFAMIYPRLSGMSRSELIAADPGSPRARYMYVADVTVDGNYYFSIERLPSPERPTYIKLDDLKARIELLMWVRILEWLEAHDA